MPPPQTPKLQTRDAFELFSRDKLINNSLRTSWVTEAVDTYGLSAAAQAIAAGQEWFTAKEAARVLAVHPKTIHFYKKNGTVTNYREDPHLLIHREEVLKLQQKGFLQRNTEEMVRSRIRITYSPKLGIARLREMSTADQVSLQTRR